MVSDKTKFVIFYGFAVLWILWGIVDYLFRYSFQVFLGLMIFGLAIYIMAVYWKRRSVIMPSGSLDIEKICIP